MSDYKQERVYSRGMYSVIKRTTEYGIVYSTVRWGSAFFERTFGALSKAIEWVDRQGDLNG